MKEINIDDILNQFIIGNRIEEEQLIEICDYFNINISDSVSKWIHENLYGVFIDISINKNDFPYISYSAFSNSKNNKEFEQILEFLYFCISDKINKPEIMEKIRNHSINRNEMKKIQSMGEQYIF